MSYGLSNERDFHEVKSDNLTNNWQIILIGI